jgi:hypothetical protein
MFHFADYSRRFLDMLELSLTLGEGGDREKD